MAKWRIFFHLVWTTRSREFLITPEVEAFLYQMLSGKCHEQGGHAFAVNSMADHVHLVTTIPPKHSPATFVGKLKGSTSRIVSLEYQIPFQWQHGYGIFSFDRRRLPPIIDYVEKQKEHHRQGTIIYPLEETSDEDEGPEIP